MTKTELLALADDMQDWANDAPPLRFVPVSPSTLCKAAAALREFAGMLGTVQKLRPDFLAGYDAGMKDMAHMIDAKIAEQPLAEPVAWIGPYKSAWDALNELRKSCAEIIGADPETWPNHGNAPLAIAATLAIARTHLEQGTHPPAPPTPQPAVPQGEPVISVRYGNLTITPPSMSFTCPPAPQRVPLTDAEIEELWFNVEAGEDVVAAKEFARAVLVAQNKK